MTSDAAYSSTAECALQYASACAKVLDAANAVLETANNAVGARNMAEHRPQHPISIKEFTELAEKLEREFPPLYKTFLEACAVARSTAQRLRASAGSDDPEPILLAAVGNDAYAEIGPAAHILRTTFGPTPASFVEGIKAANAAIRADIFTYGEDGFIGRVYAASDSGGGERQCPWCAERIEVAAIICRFCGRAAATQSTAEEVWNNLRMYAANTDGIMIDRDFGQGLILRIRVNQAEFSILAWQSGLNRVIFECVLGTVDAVNLRLATECAAITAGGVVCSEGSVNIRLTHPFAALDRDAFIETLAVIVRATQDYNMRAVDLE